MFITAENNSEGAMPAFTKSKISGQQAKKLYQFITTTKDAGMMGGYGMGPGKMRGYGMGLGMMGLGYYGHSPECQKFYDDMATLGKELHDKRFEYLETLRNPKATGESAMKLDKDIMDLQK